MAEEKSKRIKLVLGSAKGKLVRFSYLNVHEPRLNRESNKTEYSVLALLSKENNTEDIAALKDAIDQLKKEEWTNKKKPIPPNFWNPLRDGDKDTKQDGSPLDASCKGHYVINCKTDEKYPPTVVGTTKGSDGKFLPVGKSGVKSGDWGRVSVNLGAYPKGTGGVSSYLVNLQFVQAGDPLGNHSSAEDDFADFDDDGLDDDLAFG